VMSSPVFTDADSSTDKRPDRISEDGGKAASEMSVPLLRRSIIVIPEGIPLPETLCSVPYPACTEGALPEVKRERPEPPVSTKSVEPSGWVEAGAVACRTVKFKESMM